MQQSHTSKEQHRQRHRICHLRRTQPQPHSNRFGPSRAFLFGVGASAATVRPVRLVCALVLARKTASNDTCSGELAVSTGHSQIGSKVSFHSHASDYASFGRGHLGRWPRLPRPRGEMAPPAEGRWPCLPRWPRTRGTRGDCPAVRGHTGRWSRGRGRAGVRGGGPADRGRAERWPCLPQMRGNVVMLAADAEAFRKELFLLASM